MKAVLVIDMPKNCHECPIRLSGEPNEWCWYLRHGLDDIKAKPSWCPLKPLPSKELDDDGSTEWDIYYQGWSDCLDEILGETE